MSEENENYVTRAQEANEQRGVTNDEKNLRNINNNTNMVRNAADAAANSNNAYAKAIGTAIKTADKFSGGKASENLGKKINTLNKIAPGGRLGQAMMNKMSESGTTDRINSAMNKKKNASNKPVGSADSKAKANAVSEGKDNTDFSRREVEEQTSDGGGGSFKVTVKVLKIALIALAPIIVVVVFMNLIVSASQTYLGVIGLDMADEVMNNPDAEKKIQEKASEDLLNEEITDENVNEGLLGYIEDVFIDDTNKIYNKKISSINFISETKENNKYSKSQLEELEDFYSDINSYKGQGYNMDTVYKFFFKLLYIQKHYNEKYNIQLDMPLLMSILMVQSEDRSEVFISNVKDYKLYYGCSKEDNPEASDKCLPQDNPIFKIDYDWSNYTLSANDSSHDIEILAQNMVKKTSDSGCGTTVDGACYELVDDNEYREFLKEFLEKKYFIEEQNSENSNQTDGVYVTDVTYKDSSFGQITYYNQCDYSNPYGSYGTICSHGCGPTALSIVISSFLKEPHDPIEITNHVCNNGGCTSSGTAWASITSTAQDYGLKASNISDPKAVIKALSSGNSLVIALMCPGHFTTSGHFITLTGTTADGKVTVADPASRERSKEWDFNIIEEELCSDPSYWIISR